MCLNIKIWKYLCLNLANMSNFHRLEVVGRGSDTQLQVGENLKQLLGMTSIFVFNPVLKKCIPRIMFLFFSEFSHFYKYF